MDKTKKETIKTPARILSEFTWNNLTEEEKSICIWSTLSSSQVESIKKYQQIYKKSAHNYKRIYRYLKPHINKLAQQAPSDALAMLQLASGKAVSTILDLVESKNENIKLQASKDILDRALPHQDNITNIQINMPTIQSASGETIEL